MDRTDEITKLIDLWGRKLSAQIDEVRAEMKADVARVDTRLDKVEKRLDDVYAELKDGIGRVYRRQETEITEIAEIRGRVTEQSNFLQLALASRISRKPAAE